MSASMLSRVPTMIVAPGRVRSALRGAAADLGPIVTALLLVAPVVGAAVFYVWTRIATVRLGYELSQAARAHELLLEENRGLRIEVATFKNPGRLEALAKRRYGLRPPEPGQVIRLEDPVAR